MLLPFLDSLLKLVPRIQCILTKLCIFHPEHKKWWARKNVFLSKKLFLLLSYWFKINIQEKIITKSVHVVPFSNAVTTNEVYVSNFRDIILTMFQLKSSLFFKPVTVLSLLLALVFLFKPDLWRRSRQNQQCLLSLHWWLLWTIVQKTKSTQGCCLTILT